MLSVMKSVNGIRIRAKLEALSETQSSLMGREIIHRGHRGFRLRTAKSVGGARRKQQHAGVPHTHTLPRSWAHEVSVGAWGLGPTR